MLSLNYWFASSSPHSNPKLHSSLCIFLNTQAKVKEPLTSHPKPRLVTSMEPSKSLRHQIKAGNILSQNPVGYILCGSESIYWWTSTPTCPIPQNEHLSLFIATCFNPLSYRPHPRQIVLSVHVHTQWRSRPHQAGGHKS